MPLTTRLAYLLLIGMLLAIALVKAAPATGREPTPAATSSQQLDTPRPSLLARPTTADFSLSPGRTPGTPTTSGTPGSPEQQRLQSAIVETLLDARPIVAVLRLDLARLTPDIRRRALSHAGEATDTGGEHRTSLELLRAVDGMLDTFDELPAQGVGLVWILFCGPDPAGNEPQPIWLVEPKRDAFTDAQLKRLEKLANDRRFEDFPLPENPARIWISTERAPILTPRDPEHGQRFRQQLSQAGDAPITLIFRPDHLLRDHLARRDFSSIPPERRQAALWLQAALHAQQQTWEMRLSPTPQVQVEIGFQTPSQARDFALQAASLARAAASPSRPAPASKPREANPQLSPMEWVHRLASLSWKADGQRVRAMLTR